MPITKLSLPASGKKPALSAHERPPSCLSALELHIDYNDPVILVTLLKATLHQRGEIHENLLRWRQNHRDGSKKKGFCLNWSREDRDDFAGLYCAMRDYVRDVLQDAELTKAMADFIGRWITVNSYGGRPSWREAQGWSTFAESERDTLLRQVFQAVCRLEQVRSSDNHCAVVGEVKATAQAEASAAATKAELASAQAEIQTLRKAVAEAEENVRQNSQVSAKVIATAAETAAAANRGLAAAQAEIQKLRQGTTDSAEAVRQHLQVSEDDKQSESRLPRFAAPLQAEANHLEMPHNDCDSTGLQQRQAPAAPGLTSSTETPLLTSPRVPLGGKRPSVAQDNGRLGRPSTATERRASKASSRLSQVPKANGIGAGSALLLATKASLRRVTRSPHKSARPPLAVQNPESAQLNAAEKGAAEDVFSRLSRPAKAKEGGNDADNTAPWKLATVKQERDRLKLLEERKANAELSNT